MCPNQPGLLEEFSEIVAAARSLIEADEARGVRGYERLSRAQIRSAIGQAGEQEAQESVPTGLSTARPEKPVLTEPKVSLERRSAEHACLLETPKRPRVLVVGGVCSRQEGEGNQPFLGDGGLMLENMLKHVLGVERREVGLVMLRSEAIEPAAYRELLVSIVDTFAPPLILGLGSVASQALAKADGKKPVFGVWEDFRGLPVMVTLDPEHLLTEPGDKRKVFTHLKAFRLKMDAMGAQ